MNTLSAKWLRQWERECITTVPRTTRKPRLVWNCNMRAPSS